MILINSHPFLQTIFALQTRVNETLTTVSHACVIQDNQRPALASPGLRSARRDRPQPAGRGRTANVRRIPHRSETAATGDLRSQCYARSSHGTIRTTVPSRCPVRCVRHEDLKVWIAECTTADRHPERGPYQDRKLYPVICLRTSNLESSVISGLKALISSPAPHGLFAPRCSDLSNRLSWRHRGTAEAAYDALATAVASVCGNILANRSEVFYDL